MQFVCPQCRGPVEQRPDAYECPACPRTYPVACGIPDFRLYPDPYIGLEADRAKGQRLDADAQSRTFEQLLRHYYAITPEDPPDLAVHWIAHSLAEPAIAAALVDAAGIGSRAGAWLDVGCSTGGMLIAAAGRAETLVGVDVAFRWLVVGKARLRDAGVRAALVCANAEALPFPDGMFGTVTATDLLEHLRDPPRAIRETVRVAARGADALWTTNNRYCPLPDPHVKLWGLGYLPRRWQPAYLAWRRPEMHRFQVRTRSAGELRRMFEEAGLERARAEASPLIAPHLSGGFIQKSLDVYNRLLKVGLWEQVARRIGPRLWVRGRT